MRMFNLAPCIVALALLATLQGNDLANASDSAQHSLHPSR
jgi:hypothetical protein